MSRSRKVRIENAVPVEVSVLRMRPGDVLVVRSTGKLTDDSRRRIMRILRACLDHAGLQENAFVLLEGMEPLELVRGRVPCRDCHGSGEAAPGVACVACRGAGAIGPPEPAEA